MLCDICGKKINKAFENWIEHNEKTFCPECWKKQNNEQEKMRLIDAVTFRQKVKEKFYFYNREADRAERLHKKDADIAKILSWAWFQVFHAIDNAPTIDAKQTRYGYFEHVKGQVLALRCSVCQDWFYIDEGGEEDYFRYCPLCGAKIKGVKK